MSNKCDCLEIGYKSCRCEERYAKANKSAVTPTERWRNEVVIFADAMEAKLKENDHKQHWSSMPMQYLIGRLAEEQEELREAIEGENSEEILKEAADVANFAMMIADVAKSKAACKLPACCGHGGSK